MLSWQENRVKMSKSRFHAEGADPEILQNLRCSNCTKYFFPPIFLCPKGHNICTHCKPAPLFNNIAFGKPQDEPSVSPAEPEKSVFDSIGKQSQSKPSGFPFSKEAARGVSAGAPAGTVSADVASGSTAPVFSFGGIRNTDTVFDNFVTTRHQTKAALEKRVIFQGRTSNSSSESPIKMLNPPCVTSGSSAEMETCQTYYCWTCHLFHPKDQVRRSTARERSTKILEFPCGNLINGCSYRNKLFQIEEHEKICIYKIRSCFFRNCNWKGTTQAITSHLDKHTTIKVNNVERLPQGKNMYSILFDSTFFLVKTIYVPCKSLEFCILYPDDSMGVQYKYEMVFMGYNEDILIGLSNYCEPLTNEYAKEDDSHSQYISIPFDFFKNFIVDLEKIKFKINIMKLE